jgi:hypothetical protein
MHNSTQSTKIFVYPLKFFLRRKEKFTLLVVFEVIVSCVAALTDEFILFMVYLTMLSVAHTIYRRMINK